MSHKALLIGINRYRMAGADLRGCVNDVANMRDVLVKYGGFTAADLAVLTDYDATTKAMRAGIQKLVKGAKRGDVLLLHYSGHGSNVPDKNGDEADHRDEILCPTDLDWNDPLLDDWLRETFDPLPAGVNLTIVMDCCHSGTNTRAILPPDTPVLERLLPCPLDLFAVESGRELSGEVRGKRVRMLRRKAARRGKGPQDVEEVNIPEMLLAGCRSTQTSADAYIKGSYNGAMTYYLAAAIREKKGKLTCRALHARTVELLKKAKYDQAPQLEGRAVNLDRPFLAPIL